jgi:hypothetical protein
MRQFYSLAFSLVLFSASANAQNSAKTLAMYVVGAGG